MAKTNPIGVRFDEAITLQLKEQRNCDTAQKVLSFLENFYRCWKDKVDLSAKNSLRVTSEPKQEAPIKSSYFEPDPVVAKEVTLFGEYSDEFKNANSWAEIDATMKSVMLDGKLSRMEKELLKEEARKARVNNHC